MELVLPSFIGCWMFLLRSRRRPPARQVGACHAEAFGVGRFGVGCLLRVPARSPLLPASSSHLPSPSSQLRSRGQRSDVRFQISVLSTAQLLNSLNNSNAQHLNCFCYRLIVIGYSWERVKQMSEVRRHHGQEQASTSHLSPITYHSPRPSHLSPITYHFSEAWYASR